MNDYVLGLLRLFFAGIFTKNFVLAQFLGI